MEQQDTQATTPRDSSRPGLVLVVDDAPDNLRTLTEILQAEGHQVRPVRTGAQALAIAGRVGPDLVLLDITMPEMDGFEVCKRLKADPATADIPVLFLSGRSGLDDKLKAFQLGGVDFIEKPFRVEEVEARVRTHLSMRRLNEQLEDKHRELAASYDKLAELGRLRDALVAMLIHDMRSPMSVIQAAVQEAAEIEGDDGLAVLAERSVELLNHMINDTLDVSRLEAAELPLEVAPTNLGALVQEVVTRSEPRPDTSKVTLTLPPETVIAAIDGRLVSRVLDNLITNASRYGGLDNTVQVRVLIGEDGLAAVVVEDEGPGIPAEAREQVFDKFWQATNGRRMRRGVGLGLTFCKLVVTAHGGSIGVDDASHGSGAAFTFTLPMALTAS